MTNRSQKKILTTLAERGNLTFTELSVVTPSARADLPDLISQGKIRKTIHGQYALVSSDTTPKPLRKARKQPSPTIKDRLLLTLKGRSGIYFTRKSVATELGDDQADGELFRAVRAGRIELVKRGVYRIINLED